ncbi:hypothetical protein KFE25_002073 [Diacronema lutheri]|uniref:Galactokinase n=1 Tax=Diacronema lutheri TaxID=2081491 RepID=A0A8J5XL62_DIALT|nr:hypothetical protein KFE25_002073 [Diacronema lutheri]
MVPPAEQAEALFVKTFARRPQVRVSAPGRVNVIGEHTDYNGGFVLPIAIGMRTHVVGVRHPAGDACVVVSAHGDERPLAFRGTAAELTRPEGGAGFWGNYVRGVVAQYVHELPRGEASFSIAIASDVPIGGGLSSSAALEVAVATFIEVAYGLRVDPKSRALRCQKCEHDYAGVPCGIMDQMISSCGQSGHALLLDCMPPFEAKLVPLRDPAIAFVIANTNVKHQLEGSEYATRVRECRAAASAIRKRFPQAAASGKAAETTAPALLRGATMAELLACKEQMSALEFKRARHVIGEDARTLDAVEAFRRRDWSSAGRLMVESHQSLRDDYDVSTDELDALVEIATRVDGVYGARMTGGGFGGCTVTLVRAERAAELIATLEAEYERRVGKAPTCFVTKPAHGATGRWSAFAVAREHWLSSAVAIAALAFACSALARARRAP